MVPLTAKAGINTTDFGKGVQELRNKLNELNTALEENKQELKQATQEANKLRKAQQDLASTMKDGGTEEQKREMQELSDKMAQVNARIGSLRTQQSELRGSVRSANKELDQQNTELKENSESSKAAATSMNTFATAIKAVIASAAAKTLTEWLFGSNAQMEQYITSFSVMLGDADKAQKMMSELTDFAAVTPFELPDVVKNAEMLMNYGVEADKVIEKMSQLGNLAGGNAQKLDRVTIAYGQMLAKGKVTNEEMRQMLEAGVPILQAIADTVGVTTAEVQDLASKGKIGINELNAAITSLTSDGGKFAGMMEQQSKSFLGMASTAKDVIAQIGRDIGSEAFDILKDKFSELMDKIEELEASGELAEWTEEIGEGLAVLVEGFIDLAEAAIENKEKILALTAAFVAYKTAVSIAPAIEKVKTAFQNLMTSAKNLNTVLLANPYAVLAAAIAASAVALNSFYYEANKAAIKAKEFKNELNDIIEASNDNVSASNREIDAINKKVSRYEELRTKTSKTSAEMAELKDLANELQGVFGNSVNVTDKLTGEYQSLTEAAKAYAEQQLSLIKLEAYEDTLSELYKKKAEIERQYAKDIEEAKNSGKTIGSVSSNDSLVIGVSNEAANEVNKIKAEYANVLAEYDKEISALENSITDATENYYGVLTSSAYDFSASAETGTTALAENIKTVEDCRKSTDELAKSAKTLSSAFAEQETNGALSTDTILALTDAGYAAALAVDAETGAVRLDAEAYRELAKAKLEAQEADLKAQKALIEADYNHQINVAADYGEYDTIERLQKERKEATAEIDAQLMALGSINLNSVISGSYGQSGSKKTTSSSLPEGYTEGKKVLKYRLEMGEIDDSRYFEELYALMRQQGISEDSDEWRAVNVEKKKYEDKIKQEQDTESAKALKERYKSVNEAFKEASNERIEQIDKELSAKKKAADEAIAAIDAEIEARRRAKEDEDLQDEINAINAQLAYAQLDDFSRAQLERQREGLYEQQADIAWERNAEDRKSAITSQYEADAEEANREKEAIKEASEEISESLNRAAEGIANTAVQIETAASALQIAFANLSSGSAGSPSSIVNNITTNGGATTNNNTFAIGTENYTAEQIVRIIFEALGNPTI